MQDVYNYLKKLEVNFLATTRAGGCLVVVLLVTQ